MYAPKAVFSHEYAIASVYAYSVMSGGPSGTQARTCFGFDNLTDVHQVYGEATDTLEAVDAEGNVFFYGEDESGSVVRSFCICGAARWIHNKCVIHVANFVGCIGRY